MSDEDFNKYRDFFPTEPISLVATRTITLLLLDLLIGGNTLNPYMTNINANWNLMFVMQRLKLKWLNAGFLALSLYIVKAF
jgi:hypothetical protein